MADNSHTPERPWMARSDWASGRITGQNRKTMIFTLVFAGLWNGLAWPIALLQGTELFLRSDPRGLLLALFPLIGTGLAVWALRATARYLRHGQAVFQMSTVPGVIGGHLAGSVHVKLSVDEVSDIGIKLVCVRRIVSGSGKNRSTRETILWQEETKLERNLIGSGGDTVTLPVDFAVPPDAPESDNTHSNDSINWRLQISADRPGIDYSTVFEVPVFKTAESPAATPKSQTETASEFDTSGYSQPDGSRIEVTREGESTLIHLPAARNMKAILALAFFTGIWSMFFVFLMVVKAPIIFRVVWGLFDALLTLGLVNMLLVSRTILVTRNEILLKTKFALVPFVKTIPRNEVERVEMIIGMQSNTNAWYRIQLLRENGSKVVAATGLPDKNEARWLAASIGGDSPVSEKIKKPRYKSQAMAAGRDERD